MDVACCIFYDDDMAYPSPKSSSGYFISVLVIYDISELVSMPIDGLSFSRQARDLLQCPLYRNIAAPRHFQHTKPPEAFITHSHCDFHIQTKHRAISYKDGRSRQDCRTKAKSGEREVKSFGCIAYMN
jgi:hypothetical protein